MSLETFMLGRNFIEFNTFSTTRCPPHAHLGISAGDRAAIQRKRERMGVDNEDSLVASKFEGNEFYAVADGRYGDAAAILAVQMVPSIIMDELQRRDPKRALYNTAFRLDEAVRRVQAQERASAVNPQTTFLAVLRYEDKFYYVSVGDSGLYLFDDEEKMVNVPDYMIVGRDTPILLGSVNPLQSAQMELLERVRPQTLFGAQALDALGQESQYSAKGQRILTRWFSDNFGIHAAKIDYGAISPFINVGEVDVPEGATLILATDGYEDCGIPRAKVPGMLKGDLENGVVRLFQYLRNGEDNTALVAVRR